MVSSLYLQLAFGVCFQEIIQHQGKDQQIFQISHPSLCCSFWFLLTTVPLIVVLVGPTRTDRLCSHSQIRKVIVSSMIPYNKWFFKKANNSFDFLDPVQVSPVHPAACFRLDYSVVYSAVCDQLHDERTTLLLYLLLHQHQQFRNYVYTNADIQRMVVSLLKVLYNGDSQGSHHLYMSLIILLLLSEDEGFNSNVHNIVSTNILHFECVNMLIF